MSLIPLPKMTHTWALHATKTQRIHRLLLRRWPQSYVDARLDALRMDKIENDRVFVEWKERQLAAARDRLGAA